MAIKKILVTGSSGTIGTRLCEKLLDAGYNVTGVDLKHNKWSKKVDGVTIIADLTDKKQVSGLPTGFDIAVHLAANARVYDLVVSPEMALDNIKMLFNMLEYCRKNMVRRFIFASSREVYGNLPRERHDESMVSVENCESPYSASKLSGEALVNAYSKCYGMDFIVLRFSNVYGKYDDSNRVVPLFIKLTSEGKSLLVFGNDKLLDFTYIEDTIGGIMSCVEKFDAVKGRAFNIASGKGTSILDVAKMVQKEMRKENRISIGKNRPGEVIRFVADISSARELLGYKPKTMIEEGIKKSVEWYMKDMGKSG